MLDENSRPKKLEAVLMEVVGRRRESNGEGFRCLPKTPDVLAYSQSKLLCSLVF
jgi:hypothetical protein